nr:methyl-accepting chemotaxis protein [Desulforamulus aquiferis]
MYSDHEEFHRLNKLEKNDQVWEELSNHTLNIEIISFTESNNLLGELVKTKDNLVASKNKQADEIVAASKNLFLIVIGVCILLAMGLGYWLNRLITLPINQLVVSAKNASSGDLTAEVKASSKDEIGTLSESFKQMISNTRELVKNIGNKAISVSDTAEQLNASAQQTSVGASENASSINQIAVTIDNITHITQDASTQTELASDLADKGQNDIALVNNQMQEIASAVNEVSIALGALSTATGKINQFVELSHKLPNKLISWLSTQPLKPPGPVKVAGVLLWLPRR